ncbi:MAG: FAD-dependent oxidoreductase [Leptospiraceae bacterium]|nr:FAD-dependent oxidoreductase [Leptospiraceae bacterium]
MKAQYDYLIIGADAAGNSAVGQIRRNDKSGTIGILEKTEIISYGACGLPYAISGSVKSFDDLIHFDGPTFGEKTKSDVLLRHEAIAVDTARKTVKFRSADAEGEIGYGRLMIGTGAPAIRLPFVDYSSSRIFELKTVPDGRAIQQFIQENGAKKAAIIGAGYIGLEAAESFREMGLEVTIFEALERPVPRLPESLSKSIVSQMKEHGIEFKPHSKVHAVKDTGSSIELSTEAGSETFDFLLVAVGVRPATQFLEGSGIEMQKGAIVVDQYGQTNVEDVYSGGDCALAYHKLLRKPVYYPLGHTANKQGRIAGMNMSGQHIAFPGIVGTQVFKFFDRAYGLTGLSAQEAQEAGYDFEETSAMRPSRAGYYPGSDKVKMTLLLDKKDGTLLGAAMFGPLDSYGLIDAASALVNMKAKADEIAWMDFAYAPPFAPVWNALISAAGKS